MNLEYWCIGDSCYLFVSLVSFLTTVFLFSIFVLFPFYVLSFRSNRERDDEVANSTVFYMLRHFYQVVIFMEVCYFALFLSIFAAYFGYEPDNQLLIITTFSIFAFVGLVTVTVTTMENIMLSFLSIYRFSLYFFPGTESFLTKTFNFFRKTVAVLYVLIFIENFMERLAKAILTYENVRKTRKVDFDAKTPDIEVFDHINERTYIGLTIFQLLSACLYFPIICSVRKMGRLQSAKTSQPEKYILYQTFFLVVFRLIYIPAIVFLFINRPEASNETLIWFGMVFVDLCITHFVIQASYLSCNKKHAESLLRFCGSKKNSVMDLYTKHMESTTVATN